MNDGCLGISLKGWMDIIGGHLNKTVFPIVITKYRCKLGKIPLKAYLHLTDELIVYSTKLELN